MSRQYINASKALTEVLSGKSLKNYCNRNKVGKTEYALICETIKYIDVIEKLFEVCQISAESLDVNKGLLLVYCYELLFGNGKIQGGGVVKRRLLEIEHEIRDALLQMMHQRGVDSHESLIDSHFVEHDKMPVYIRINTLKIDEAQGRRLLFETYPGAARDQHIPNLISLPAGTKRAWDHELVKGGALIVQDKASCMPSQIFFDAWLGGDIIDACAAPGNKTSHVAALVQGCDRPEKERVNIYACEKSETRCELLRNRMKLAGANNVIPLNVDFLSLQSNDPKFSKVASILVDPSCSGSGVVRAIDRVYERVKIASVDQPAISTDRLKQLQAFQIRAVLHAMSFPSVQLVVYSTCSVDLVENECVVAEILQRNSGWKISSPPRFQSWERRGFYIPQLTTEQSNCLIRCAPDDGANGFFVALFHRLSIESQHKIIQCHSKVEMHLDSEHHALDEDVDISIYKKRMHSSGKKDDNKRNGTNMQWQHFSKRFKY